MVKVIEGTRFFTVELTNESKGYSNEHLEAIVLVTVRKAGLISVSYSTGSKKFIYGCINIPNNVDEYGIMFSQIKADVNALNGIEPFEIWIDEPFDFDSYLMEKIKAVNRNNRSNATIKT